jgi:hypothetical protein
MVALLFGCAQLTELEGKSAEQVARGVKSYCDETDETFRERHMEQVNEFAAPDAMAIHCDEE